MRPAHEHHDLLHPILWPFRGAKEWGRMWWLLLVDYIPVLNLIVLRGWRLDVTRRMARRQTPMTPDASSLLGIVGNGILLWTMTAAYAFLPLILIAQLGIGGFKELVNDFVELARILVGRSEQHLGTFIQNELIESLLAAALELIWIPVSSPLYRASMIRYAVTGNVASFGNLPSSIALVFRHLGTFAKMYLFSFLLGLAITVGGAILLATGIGALIVPLVTLPLYYWATAFEYGELARDHADERARKGIVESAPSAFKQALAGAALVFGVVFVAVRSVTETVSSAAVQLGSMVP